jgi:hypothetical protein
MKRLIITLAVLLATVATVAVSESFAANPESQKLDSSGTFTEPDFCGTGVPVAIDSSFRGTLFVSPNQDRYEFWLTLSARDVFTNLVTGSTATIHAAGVQRWSFVHDGDPSTPPLTITLDQGLRSQIVSPGDGLVVRDAGYVVQQFTFTIFDGQILVEHGPHPSLAELLETGSDTFCPTMTSVLGID